MVHNGRDYPIDSNALERHGCCVLYFDWPCSLVITVASARGHIHLLEFVIQVYATLKDSALSEMDFAMLKSSASLGQVFA